MRNATADNRLASRNARARRSPSAAPYIQKKLGGKLAIGREIIAVQDVFGKIFNAGTEFVRDGSEFDRLFDDGDRFSIGDIPAIALHVPGHTPADMAYVIGDVVFTGDTLFMPDYGTARADFPAETRGNSTDRSVVCYLCLTRPGFSYVTTTRRRGGTPSVGNHGRRRAEDKRSCP